MSYQVTIRRSALKALRKINEPYYGAIKEAIYELALDPRPLGYVKLKGRSGYRIRVGTYRVIYEIIEQELLVDVISLGHRKDIYE